VPPHSASLNIERISYLASGKVVEFTRSRYRADAYDFVAELRISETQSRTG
jgi:GntR family transcriptional regulator